ncbi:unnamed protein product [Orchesella dallaii]|uniref:Uncharacterized protein n=1 Tax=Orchesella dallaii TaxID=48710 RepID=A0ABP1PQ84_9HEXA
MTVFKEVMRVYSAEIELELNGDKMYRFIGKRSEFNKPIIGPLPKIACQRPTTTTARTTTTTAKSTRSTTAKSTGPTTFKPPRSTTRRITSSETTITEITTDITTTLSPYIRCKTPDCNIVRKNLHDSTAELFTSFYESIMDTCMCFERDMKNNFTDKKYTFGGLHYGLPIPESQLAPTDPLFNDCLQFYFDPETRCLIFILEECNVAQIESFVLEEFQMLALGSRDSVSSSAFPFGRFELVDSLGNCGNLINDKAPKPRRALRLPNKSEACPQRSYSFIDFGMIPGKGPIFERLKPYPSLVLQGNSSRGVNIVKSLVYALRFSTDYNFGRVIPSKRMRYINFALQIVSLLNLKNTPPQRKYQSISMKTPIMDINYNESDPTDTEVFITDIRRKTNQTHELSYFQLHEDVHDELFYRGNSCPVVMRKYPKPIVVVKAHEETCYCFSSPRSPSPDTPPMQLSEFLEDVVTQTPYPLPISEDCFIISFNKSPKDLCHTDPDFRVARVMFSFGLTCAGEEGLEIRDMIVQANNRMGYPVGSWTAIDVDSSGLGVKCAEQLKEHDPNVALGKQWTIREVKHVYQFHCPDVDIGSHSSIEDARMETFLQRERPHMLFYNHNLTLHAINNDKNFGFCAWWEFHSPEQYIHGHPEDFYFDFQFVVTANINHIPSGKNYVVAFRGPKAGFNMKTCDVDNIDDPKEVLMDKNYYNEKVNEHKQLCIEVLVYRDRFEDGLCGCFIGTYEHNSGPSFNTHRIQISEYNETDPIKEEIEILQQCLQVQMLPGRRHNNYEIYVNYKLKNAAPCIKDHWFYEVVFQVINNNGLPMGNWDAELVTGGTGCKTANELGEAEISLHKCHQSRVHAENGLYKAPSDNVDVLHFKNRWKDEHFQDLCVRWKYPREYANINKGDPTKFPANLQIYVQAQVYRKSSKRFLTSPTFSSKKMKFTEAGTFDTRSLISKLPIEHENDYLNFLATDFDQGPINYCIPYPQPPEYASSTCRMFHATPHPMKHSVRDLDNPKDLLALPYIRDNCFSFNAYPGNEPLSMHLNFRQEKTNGNCDVEKGIHFAVTAYNELGFPIGRIYPGKGLTHYNHPRVPSNDRRFCGAEDIAVTEETILPVDDESCPFFGDDSRNLTFSTIKEFYKQEASVDQLPNMIGFGTDPRAPPRGICFHWIYDSQKAPQSTPEFIQFYFEFFVPFDEENLNDGKHYVMRSKKFQMNYIAGNPIPPVPNPVKKCHDEATSQGSFFEPLPIPTEFWSQWHDYNIYPDKMLYRRCLEEYRVFGTCKTSLKGKPLLPVINPIVIVPGGDGDNNEDYKYRHYNSTKVIYDGCIASKLCFAPISDSRKADPSSDCIVDMTCEMVWALGKQPIRRQDAYLPTPDDDEIVVEIYGKRFKSSS